MKRNSMRGGTNPLALSDCRRRGGGHRECGCLSLARGVEAKTFTPLYQFKGGADSGLSALVVDNVGNVYGATGGSGAATCATDTAGCGTIFRLDPPATGSTTWTKTVLYTFQGGTDGYVPISLAVDKAGNIYGATAFGGDPGDTGCGGYCGVAFKLTPPGSGATNWTKSTIFTFSPGSQKFPSITISDKYGNLFGYTNGTGPWNGGLWGGSVFALSPPKGAQTTWTLSTLHQFAFNEAWSPNSLKPDPGGFLYGTTFYGGDPRCLLITGYGGCGAVFTLTPPQSPQIVWSYAESGIPDPQPYSGIRPKGCEPTSIARDKFGNYVVAASGCGQTKTWGHGTLLSYPSWTGLYAFDSFDSNPSDGQIPQLLVTAPDGHHIFGTTQFGGGGSCTSYPFTGCGTIFVTGSPTPPATPWPKATLHFFSGLAGGSYPNTLAIAPGPGVVLYVGTYAGARGYGAISRLTFP